ncbi:HD domain-containing protein [Candidatus Nanosalina sp. VS9-1]|uniref:HD domain-containing protein n=1 Tax=Candidatus Nanosalina sp. VS9-1 TaxID=3388566 RepID=UPI0039DFE34B
MKDLEEFFNDINELKHTEREGWKDVVDRPRDTIASHSFGAALLGWALSEKEGLESDKIVKMLLMHDLIMAYVEDFTPEDEEFDSKKEMEREASERLFNDIPDEIEDEFRDLFHELQEQETEEARFAKECDKLDTLFQASKYSEETGEDHLREFLDFYRENFESDTGKKVFSSLEQKSFE